MAIYYSPNHKGFFSDEVIIRENMPSDVIEINDALHKEMLYQFNNNLKDIIISDSGQILYTDRKVTSTWDTVRTKRNRLLTTSDYTQMPDYPGDKQAWAKYRQELRDITKTFSDPNEVIWPEQPK